MLYFMKQKLFSSLMFLDKKTFFEARVNAYIERINILPIVSVAYEVGLIDVRLTVVADEERTIEEFKESVNLITKSYKERHLIIFE